MFLSMSSRLAWVLGYLGETGAALNILERTRPTFDAMLGDEINNIDLQRETLSFLHAEAILMARMGLLQEAEEGLTSSLLHLGSVNELPRDADWRRTAAALWMLLGDLQLAQTSAASAENSWSRGLVYLSPEEGVKEDPEWILVRFELSNRLGLTRDADSLRDKLVDAGVDPNLAGDVYRLSQTFTSDSG